MEHPTFEEGFTELAKGLPDLERIVSRIHAKNCRVKDFIKVLTVRWDLYSLIRYLLLYSRVYQAFKKLSKGLSKLADSSETFESKTILGLLRSAPDLIPHIKNIESIFQIDKGGISNQYSEKMTNSIFAETDDLIPAEGKDEVYDGDMAETGELETMLNAELKKFEKKLG